MEQSRHIHFLDSIHCEGSRLEYLYQGMDIL